MRVGQLGKRPPRKAVRRKVLECRVTVFHTGATGTRTPVTCAPTTTHRIG